MNSTTKKTLDYATIAQQLGRKIVRDNLGQLRSHAAMVAQTETIDEEAYFKEIANAFLEGMKLQVSDTFGAEETVNLLNPFVRN